MNMFSNREGIVVLSATLVFFGTFGLIVALDRPHGEIG
jgi:hypothetical protein